MHREDQNTSVVLHAFLDLINERKARGRVELVATHATIAEWLSERTRLDLRPSHVASLTLALQQAGIISIGGMGIGMPNTYDTCEKEMGIDQFWNQVDAFLLVYRLPRI